MSAVNSKEVVLGLRSQLSLNVAELPNFRNTEVQLWRALHQALLDDETAKAKALSWIDLDSNLCDALRSQKASSIIGKLCESSVCSFAAVVSEDDFMENFGKHGEWVSLYKDARIQYFRARFASIYWCSIRDYAVRSRADCISIFHISPHIVNVIADSLTSDIIDYCHGFPNMQSFRLTCRQKDCSVIASLCSDPSLAEDFRKRKLFAAKLIKSNHCAAYMSRMEDSKI